MMALAIGTGVGINTAMGARFGVGKREAAQEFAGIGTPLAGILWLLFAVVSWLLMPAYASLSSPSPEVVEEVVIYGRIVCVFRFGLFFESIWTKILQAQGDMRTPMAAQILGAVTNIGLDPLLIFGLFGLPEMGIAGAAVATVIGQVAAALVVMKKGYRKSPAKEAYPRRVAEIFRLGTPNIPMVTSLVFPAVFKRRAPQPRRCCKRRCPPLHNCNRSGTEKPPQSCSFCGGFFCRPSGCVLMSGL